MHTRRFLLKGIAALVAGSASSSITAEDANGTMRDRGPAVKFGAQTNAWHIDPHSFDSLMAVLAQIRQVGYSGFETGFGNVMEQFPHAADAKRRIESTGLTFFGIHIFLPSDNYDPETRIAPASLYEKVAKGGAALGARHLIFSSVPTQNSDQLRHKAAGLNTAGRFAKHLGISLAYHNEKNDEGEKELEALYDATDPQYVSFLLDAGHAYLAGIDVPAFVRKHSHRIVGIHLRDFKDSNQVPLGQGTFPLQATSASLKRVRWRGWVLNEEERTDGTKAGLKFIEPAFNAARKAFS
jgi:inosose dehydratase